MHFFFLNRAILTLAAGEAEAYRSVARKLHFTVAGVDCLHTRHIYRITIKAARPQRVRPREKLFKCICRCSEHNSTP